ncbi:MAG: hypothetical protein WA662_09720 [Pseudolabrys sp.]
MNRMGIMGMLITLLLVTFTSSSANGYHSRRGHHNNQQISNRGSDACMLSNDGRSVCNASFATSAPRTLDAGGNRTFAMAETGSVIGSRPAGCPNLYCGCGLRKYLGLGDVRLNLASNWARLLPREAGPRPGLAAVRSGHVMYIESAAGNGQWLIRDYNSGGGLSRMHVRDVRGYIFVNPHGAMARG